MKNGSEQKKATDFSQSLRKTGKMLLRVFPNIFAVVLLSGLIMEFVPMDRLSAFLGGGFFTDGLIGAGIGSISIGNPLVSYVLGGELIDQGISLMAVTALLVSWVTVGSIQLPAEIQTFGSRFALFRNGISFVFAILIAFLVLVTMRFLAG
jgi:hypothetical protein